MRVIVWNAEATSDHTGVPNMGNGANIVNRSRDERQRFTRTRAPWDPNRWDDGYIDNRGYFRVYRPDFPGSYGDGYAKRARVVYWIQTGHVIQAGEVLHHKSGDRLDDRFENLELLTHGEHTIRHHKKQGVPFECETCGGTFNVPQWRIAQRMREGSIHGWTGKVRFCSQGCYHKSPIDTSTNLKRGESLRRAYREGRR